METNDTILWSIARKRACFKRNFINWFLVNGFLWAIWLMGPHYNGAMRSIPWPAWITFWWGIGLAFNFVNAYLVHDRYSIRSEYEKLKRDQTGK